MEMASEENSETSKLVGESGTSSPSSASPGKEVDPIELSVILPACNATNSTTNGGNPGSATNCVEHAGVHVNHNHNIDSPVQDRQVHVPEDKPLLSERDLNQNPHHTEECMDCSGSKESPQRKLLSNQATHFPSNEGANSSSVNNATKLTSTVKSDGSKNCTENDPSVGAPNNTQLQNNMQSKDKDLEGNRSSNTLVIHNHIEPNVVIDSSNGGQDASDSESELDVTSHSPENDSKIQTVPVSIGKILFLCILCEN